MPLKERLSRLLGWLLQPIGFVIALVMFIVFICREKMEDIK